MTDKPAEDKTDKPEENKKNVPKFQQSLEQLREESNEKQMIEIEKERTKQKEAQRFGYFSIPYPAVVGDKAYSQNKEFHHKIIDGKVVTENRGVYTQCPKTGKTPEVYFKRIEPVSDKTIEKYKEMNQKDYEAKLKEVKDRKNAQKGIPEFRPGGPQVIFGYYENIDKNLKIDQPLYKEKDRFRFIDKENHGKVFSENRGIYPHVGFFGKNPIPKDYFSFYFLDKELEDRNKKIAQEEKEVKKIVKSKSEAVYRKPFSPASLKKNECFFNIQQTYGLHTDAEYKELLKEHKKEKEKGRAKYQNVLPKGALKHDAPFHPARLKSSGREALFNDDLYKIPRFPEEKKEFIPIREIREKEKENARVPFRYNRMMDHSTFAPSLSSNSINMRREFPKVYN